LPFSAASCFSLIEAARPVDLALNFGGLDGPRYHVQNRLVALADNHIFHWHTVDRAAIVRLAAGGGIEICLIENEGGVIVERGALAHASHELPRVGVGIIQPFSH